MKEKTLKRKLSLVYFMVYGSFACYGPFLVLYFKYKGLSYTQIGAVLAISSIVSVASQPMWGIVSDKYLNKRKAIIILAATSSLLTYGFMFAANFYMIIAVVVVFVIFSSSLGPIMDAFCYEMIDKHRTIQYGRIRLMGSLGYALVVLALGEMMKSSGIYTPFYAYLVLGIIAACIAVTIHAEGKSNNARISLNDITQVVKNKFFLVFVLAVMLINIPMVATGSYMAVLVEATGGDASVIGFLWFIIAITQIPSFFMGNKILRYNELTLFCIAVILFGIRFILAGIASHYSIVILIQLMECITFPVYLMASLQFLNKVVPPAVRASGITLYAALGGGIGGFIGNLTGGLIVQQLGVFWMFRIAGLMAFISAAVALILKSKWNTRDKVSQ